MYGNHKPDIRGTDDALWSRVKLVPFEVSFADRIDLKLPEKLRKELPGILNWAIAGCLAWQKHGLHTPAKVDAATATGSVSKVEIDWDYCHTGPYLHSLP
jgi:putative DNA primase/helicase